MPGGSMSGGLDYKTTELLNFAAQGASGDKNYFPTMIAGVFIGVAFLFIRKSLPLILDSLRSNKNPDNT